MSEPMTIGWKVLDPDGRVVDAGEVTALEVDLIEEIAQRMAIVMADNSIEGGPSWPE